MDHVQMSLTDFLRSCRTCRHFAHYVAGLGEWIHGTACLRDRPYAHDVEPGKPACEHYQEEG